MQPRLFTVEEANALLPRLRQILASMQQASREMTRLQQQLNSLHTTTAGNGHTAGAQISTAREELQRFSADLESGVAELNAMGCELKGLDQGLIDFRGLRDGRVVYLCWQLGEDEVTWWHELDTGFGGRQRL